MKRILITVIAACFAFSCDEFLDVNKNPNQATVSTPQLVLSNALAQTAAQNFYNQMGAMFAGQWAPSGDVSGFVQEKTYDFNNTYGTGIWTTFYDILNDYKYVQEADAERGQLASGAIAKIMSTFLYHKLVDTYGNIPYTDALQGTTVIRPSYDDAQSVYEAIIDDLDEARDALLSIDDPGDNPGAFDIVFGGNIDRWVEFANTLKLRLLIRQSEMPGRVSYIQAELAEITGGYLATDAIANPGYLKTAGKQNPFWDTYYKSENDALRNTYNFIRSTSFLVSTITTSDPRLYKIVGPRGTRPHYEAKTNVGTAPCPGPTCTVYSVGDVIPGPFSITGVTYGDESPAAYSNASSGIGSGILKAYNQGVVLISAAESFFLQTEAVYRGWIAGDATTLYNSAITASFNLLAVPDPNTTTAANEATVTFYTTTAPYDGTLQRIITQKYIAMTGFAGFEAWADYRRTGLPNVPLSTKAIKDAIPVRLYYPNQELQTNSENVAAQGSFDAITSKVFWDAN
jgi:hypothetical protein